MNDPLENLSEEHKGWLLLVGRLALASVFLLGAINWIFLKGQGPVGLIVKAGWPMPELLAWLALFAKATGAISVSIGLFTRYGALMLIAFTAVASIGFHMPASVMPPDTLVFKEIGLIGGFLILIVVGPGKLSVDALLAKRQVPLSP